MAATSMVQVNVRVSSDVKQRAEEQLERIGSSVSALVRSVLDKVAQGPKECAEVTKALQDDEVDEETARKLALAEEGWKLADDFCLSLGIEPGQVEEDTRTWDEVRQEAMDAHFAEKGYFQ